MRPNWTLTLLPVIVSVQHLSLPCFALPIRGAVDVRATTVHPVGTVGGLPDAGIGNDFSFANRIYSQIGLSLNNLTPNAILLQNSGTPGAQGTWTPAQVSGAGGLLAGGTNPNTDINVFYVNSYPSAFGQAWSAEDVPGNAANVGAVMDNPGVRRNDTFGHELGHVLLDRWRWRAQETGDGGIHSNNANDLMAAGAIRNIPANVNQCAPYGANDSILANIGPLSNSATATVPQITAMYYQNTFIKNLTRDGIGVEVEAANANFNWGDEQANIGGLRVNEAAYRFSAEDERVTFHFRNPAGFAAGAGGANALLDLVMLGITSVDTPYDSVQNITCQTSADILANRAAINNLANPADFTAGFVFNNMTNTLSSGTVRVKDNLLVGLKDIFVSFDLKLLPAWTINESGNWTNGAINWAGPVPNAQGAVARFLGAITAPRTVTLDANITVGSVIFNNTNAYTIAPAGANRLTLSIAGAGNAGIDMQAGNHNISAPLTLASNTTVNIPNVAQVLTLADVTLNAGVSMNKAGAGRNDVKNIRAAAAGGGLRGSPAGLTISQGTVRVVADGSDAGTSNINYLSIAGTPVNPTATLDLSNNDMVIDYEGASPILDIANLISAGASSSFGITTSASNFSSALGYGQSDDLFSIFPATFSGQQVDDTAVLIRFTYYGDADLDGGVGLDDFNRLATNFNLGGKLWGDGDFTYDGFVGLNDFNRLAINFGLSAGPDGVVDPEDWAALAAAIPEPGGIGIGVMLLAVLYPGRRANGGLARGPNSGDRYSKDL